MQRTLEFEAALDSSWGTSTCEGHSYPHQGFGKDAAFKANEKGEILIDGDRGEKIKGVIENVIYVAVRNQPGILIDDKAHKFTFEEYVQMGRPRVIKVKKTLEYESIPGPALTGG